MIQPGTATSHTSDINSNTPYAPQLAPDQKDEVIGVLLAIFLGDFGAHHFYLRRNGLGVLYLLLFWTGIPALLGLIECFFMPGRVRRYNAEQIRLATMTLLPGSIPATDPPVVACHVCGTSNWAQARFCRSCGAAIQS